SPLASVESFVATTCPACGGPARRETDVSDTFFDSSWYFLRHPSADLATVPWDHERTARMLPVDLYARFVTMALRDLGLVAFDEPFPRLRLHGTVTKDGAKMSKSRGNVVNPDDYVDRHGGDVLRAHLLSSGRWSATADFRDVGITGVERLFIRVWRLAHGEVTGPGLNAGDRARGVARVAAGIEAMRFHTALGTLRELADRAAAADVPVLVRMLAPFAPYLAEELWARVGGAYSVHVQPWPHGDGAQVAGETVELVVQVDGRRRGRLTVPARTSPAEAQRRAESEVSVARHLVGRRVERCVHVPDRLVNLVTTPA
ncbi:MAG TPA: class I tRNA ligase family protein, partial [Actinomycetes bacterium]|nr:class I tRNA ligase family protein [Actinomycetes bacterium]